ncbi:MAG: PorT family protein [Bacteroides sp.]|nr:PorT family protein [Bacteroides sp.]
MKRIFLILLIAVAAMTTAQKAQAQFRWGATAGVTLTTLDFSQNLFAVDSHVGGTAGVKGELMFPGIGFGIEFGALYELRGAGLHLGDKPIWSTLGYGKKDSYLQYLDIPLHLKFKWTRMDGFEDYLAPFVQGGPELNILLGHNHNSQLDYNAVGLGLTAGGGVELFKRWQLGVFYSWGMTNAVRMPILTDFTATNRTWNFRVTYFF